MNIEQRLNIIRKDLKEHNYKIVPGGREGYKIIEITNFNDIITLHENTRKVHKYDQIYSLYTKSFFISPQTKTRHDRNSRYGDVRIKNAIVDYLKELPKTK